ncbi:hypothetical protein H5T87_01715 [bacterium]|nr:hypothetical protein [bacterium]
MADPISVDLHARWAPDYTISPPSWQCAEGGATVAGEVEFHFVANYQAGPIMQVNCQKIEIIEQTDVHTPDSRVLELAFAKTLPPPNYPPPNISNHCSNPPSAGFGMYYICATKKEQTLSCHNVAYKVRATYQYILAGPPPRVVGPLTIERTFIFGNLIVIAQPKILKWDPDNPAICDTTFSYSLSSAQKKNCSVTINIHNLDVLDNEGKPLLVYQTTLTNPCPGNYSFTWDGTANQTPYPPNNIAPAGLYTFDIIVQSSCPYDGDKMRSSALKIAGHEVNEPTEEITKYEIKYLLQDTKKASQAGVELYDIDLGSMMSLQGPSEISPTWNNIELEETAVDMSKGGPHIFLFWAIDDHKETDKAHRCKPALEVIDKKHVHKWKTEVNKSDEFKMTPPNITVDKEYIRASDDDKDRIVKITIAKKEDKDKCTLTDPACSFPNGVAKNLIKVVNGEGGTGKFGELDAEGNFIPWNEWKEIELKDDYTYIYYKCPDTTGVITLTFTFDDIPMADDPAKPQRLNPINTFDDEPITADVKLTVWDFTIGEISLMPSWNTSINLILKILPPKDHNGNSLSAPMQLVLYSSMEPEVCKNKTISSILQDPNLSLGIPEDKKNKPWDFMWDLQFTEEQDDFSISSTISYPPQRNIANSKEPKTSAYIKIDCWDYGAHGYIVAQANIPNIGVVLAHAQNKPKKYYAEIPVDENDNYISDSWAYDNGGANDDDDNDPSYGTKGDGISRYDEYRGFFANGVHIRTNPNAKDVFIYDENNLGIGYFSKTGLTYHLNPEPNDDHKVTRYDSTGHLGYDQFYIRLKEVQNELFDPEGNMVSGRCTGFLGENVSSVCQIDTAHLELLYPGSPDAKPWIIAHELGHAVTLDWRECSVGWCIMQQRYPRYIYCEVCKSLIKLHP